jgi:hypothetical protein
MAAGFPSLVRSPLARSRAVRIVLLLAFAWLGLRFWHPYYGFTQFLQIDGEMAARIVPALRDSPIFIAPGTGSYDGGYYAQIATNPALDPAILHPAIDDAGYRARRILLGAVAWVAGGGDAMLVAQAYAGLNVGLWFVLAAVLWRVFPAGSFRSDATWAALLFGAGVLFSVRLALTDLAALLLTVGAVLAAERGHPGGAAGLVGLAGLTRETAVLGAVALAGRLREGVRGHARTAAWALLAVAPLALWLAYVHYRLGGSSAGQRNLTWPFAGWAFRWSELARGLALTGNPWLTAECVLEHVALTVQVIYLAWRARWECRWWRVGAAYLLLFAALGHAVWGGFPNAATRVLLPLTLAFNVRVVRDGAHWAWLLVGNLSILAGVHAMSLPPGTPHQLPMPSTWEQRHLLETDERWSVAEENDEYRWAWCAGEGGLQVRAWPHPPAARLELQLRAVTPREIEVRHAGQVVWRGPVGDRPQWIMLPELPYEHGRLRLELRSPAPAVGEGVANTARDISFACFGARLAK